MKNANGMSSLKALYKIGKGPSSSHTMGPEKASKMFKSAYPDADRYLAVLYGSLAKTGKGHLTDKVIIDTMAPLPCSVEFNETRTDLPHPNTMELLAYKGDTLLGSWEVYSVGGGSIRIKGEAQKEEPMVYTYSTFGDIAAYCEKKGIRIWQYVEEMEGPGIWDYLLHVWHVMCAAIDQGLSAEGELHGGLHVQRKAKFLYEQHPENESPRTKEERLVCAYAYAVSEQNASSGTVVTAPTCGAAGVLPAVLRYQRERGGYSDTQVLHALATAGIVGNIIKTNASISGAECGCQAEIGSACSMASAALAELFGMDIPQIEYAAEIAMETPSWTHV